MLDLTEPEKAQIRSSWSKVMSAPDLAAKLFYARLFEDNPEVRPLFKGDIRVQGTKLIETVNTVVDNLDQDLSAAVSGLGQRHQGYTVSPEHYPIVGAALIWMLREIAGASFGEEAEAAWESAYGQISDSMLKAYHHA